MKKVKLYDPYYIIDPTKPHDWLPHQGRTQSGKFTHNSTLTGAGDDNFGINSNYWARYARGSRDALDALRDEEYRFSIIPDETAFSWRMLCEVYEVAVKALRDGKTDEEALAAAWGYLQGKQYDTARTKLEELVGDVKDGDALNMSQVLSDWFAENWDVIPEVEF